MLDLPRSSVICSPSRLVPFRLALRRKSNVWKGSDAIRSAVCPNAEFEEPDWERRGCFDRDELRWEIE
jgi:hypothetical protein